jgi:hypothetical protein
MICNQPNASLLEMINDPLWVQIVFGAVCQISNHERESDGIKVEMVDSMGRERQFDNGILGCMISKSIRVDRQFGRLVGMDHFTCVNIPKRHFLASPFFHQPSMPKLSAFSDSVLQIICQFFQREIVHSDNQ